MNPSSPLSLSVKMSAISLTPGLLDNLASEYYGSVLTASGEGQSETEVVEFAGVEAERNVHLFSSALDSFRLRS